MLSDNALQYVSLFSVATSPGSISGALGGISKLHLVHAARILPDPSFVMGRRGGNELTLPNSLIAVRLQSQYKRATVTIPSESHPIRNNLRRDIFITSRRAPEATQDHRVI